VGTVFGSGDLGEALEDALGALTGTEYGNAEGLQGMATRGAAPGGSGLSEANVNLGDLATRGRAGGNPRYGEELAALEKTHSKLEADEMTLLCESLAAGEDRPCVDRTLLRDMVWRNRRQIRHCYERELQRDPSLQGRLVAQWTVDASGKVSHASITESNLHHAQLERCVVARIESWNFPDIPGEVVVRYPFILRRIK
jgi:hypothetical protein